MTGIMAMVKPARARCHCFVYCPKKKNIFKGIVAVESPRISGGKR